MPPLPSIPTVDGPAVIVDSDGVVGVVDGDKAGRANGSAAVPGLLNDSLSSASCTDELHGSANTSTNTSTGTELGPGPHADMEVLGIYKRGSVPREAELPPDYVLKDCQPDQVMVRRRLQTRPLLDDDQEEEEHEYIEEEDSSDSESSSSSDSSDDDGSDADGESATQTNKEEQTQKPKKKKMDEQTKKERTAKSLRRRRRLKSRAADGTEYDVALFRPEEGLVMRKSDWPFYHADLSEHSDSSDDERVSGVGSCSYCTCYVSLILLEFAPCSF